MEEGKFMEGGVLKNVTSHMASKYELMYS